MKHKLYTFIGCSLAIEHQIRQHGEPAADVNSALAALTSIRESLLVSSAASGDVTLETALNEHVTSLLEAIEMLRASQSFAHLDDSLIDLLDHYYNIGDSLMGGGGDSSWSGSSSSSSSSSSNGGCRLGAE